MRVRALNLLVFREGRRIVSGNELKSALIRQLDFLPKAVSSRPESNEVALSTLLRAGELECAAVDGGLPPYLFQTFTDLSAEALLSYNPPELPANYKFTEFKASLEAVALPETLALSTPEGFAYYGLHPLLYADALEKIIS